MVKWSDYVTSFIENSKRALNLVKCSENIRDHSWEPLYKVHYILLGVAPTLHPNHKESFDGLTKERNLNWSMEQILYHNLLVGAGLLVIMLKIVENLSGSYSSATI